MTSFVVPRNFRKKKVPPIKKVTSIASVSPVLPTWYPIQPLTVTKIKQVKNANCSDWWSLIILYKKKNAKIIAKADGIRKASSLVPKMV